MRSNVSAIFLRGKELLESLPRAERPSSPVSEGWTYTCITHCIWAEIPGGSSHWSYSSLCKSLYFIWTEKITGKHIPPFRELLWYIPSQRAGCGQQGQQCVYMARGSAPWGLSVTQRDHSISQTDPQLRMRLARQIYLPKSSTLRGNYKLLAQKSRLILDQCKPSTFDRNVKSTYINCFNLLNHSINH